ncbi:MAG: TetR family transcriptional regulator [Nitriliruptorales bacterium]|nr:TetR family transcriptional regulator [Nitriliruptorales bacterium]
MPASATDTTPPLEELAGAPTRERLLLAAEHLAATQRWSALTMSDVASLAGVSRQTVYNEFGNKTALGEQVALRVAVRVVDAVQAEMAQHDEIQEAIAAAVTLALDLAEEEPLVRAVLTGARGGADESLLPFLTTRAGPILSMAATALTAQFVERWPELDEEEVELVAESAVRLIVSHIVQATDSHERTGRRVAWMLARVVGVGDESAPLPS